ncbi:TonB-dependent receptor [Cellulophaga sp. E16_2]|uniref:TonB-dependent receptor n=1 Tax=Cellulophaga sp. E16_2 TaxID=2789297 RepID=UPI001A924FED|nr:TonB-dependent receptor [Cellulophaga sp. E16_2]MBO0590230.1 TonB-dependent receptor [Cellulophaga sp. E16_2]
MNNVKSVALFLVLTFNFLYAYSQVSSYGGTIIDANGKPIEGATLSFEKTSYYGISDVEGNFLIANLPIGNYTISISHLGFKTFNYDVKITKNEERKSFVLEADYLNLQAVVVTGSFISLSAIKTATAISTINEAAIKQIYPQGTASLLQHIPGTFTDASAGEVFTKVYTRGISASAEDDLGWYYVSLEEDGLPVSLVQHSYYSPDLFHRVDLMTERVEAVRGGSASITAMNAPGGIYNFISQGPKNRFGGEVQLLTGFQHSGNFLNKIDAVVGGSLGNNWFLNAGGHYRHDDGARDTNFTFSKGGQFKFNLMKENAGGYVKLYGKYLNDKTNRYNGVAAVDWKNPKPAFGQDFNTTALLMPAFNASIPDGRDLNKVNSFDPSQGVHAKDLAFGLDIFQSLGNNWSVKNNMKFSSKSANWQTSISNAFLSISDPTGYYLVSNGNPFPVGQLIFRDANSGTELARIDNSGIFTGASSQYLTDGTLPNDAIMGTSTWYKDNNSDEFMQQLTLRKEWEQHDLSFGFASGFSDTSVFTQGSFAFATYENNPRMLQVTLENPNEPVLALSDEFGVSNYGGLFFSSSSAKVTQLATFANDRWKLSDNLHLDLGLRLESIKHKGSNDRFAPFSQDGGLDGDETTAYDNNILQPTGAQDSFNYNYNYVSYSTGINYKKTEDFALFGRFSKGHKAPELNYYFNNFSNVPIHKKGEVQDINQVELGMKSNVKNASFTTTLFWSQLKNIGVTNFEFDGDTGSIFYTPIQFNSSRTIGLEWESIYAPFGNFAFHFNGIIQNPKATKWDVYDAAGTVDTSDDSITDFSGNSLAFNPKLMFNLSTEFHKNKTSSFIKWRYMGKRDGNVANAFQLAAYSVFDAGIGYKINSHLSLNILATNLLNSAGLANFFGANSFGANANGVTSAYIENNPDQSFVVVPILPRSIALKINYMF